MLWRKICSSSSSRNAAKWKRAETLEFSRLASSRHRTAIASWEYISGSTCSAVAWPCSSIAFFCDAQIPFEKFELAQRKDQNETGAFSQTWLQLGKLMMKNLYYCCSLGHFVCLCWSSGGSLLTTLQTHLRLKGFVFSMLIGGKYAYEARDFKRNSMAV